MYWIGDKAKTPMLGAEEELALLKAYHENPETSSAIRNKIVSANYGLVLNLAARYERAYNLSSEDLFQEGVIGMCKAVDRFDPEQKNRFATYATYWVKLALIQFIKKNSKLVTMTGHANNQITSLKKEDHKKLRKKWGEYRYNEIKNLANPDESRNPIGKADGLKDSKDFLGKIKIDSIKEVLNKIIKTFSVREKVILRCRFCLNSGKRKKLDEIGRAFHVTKECIRQLERKAVKKIKKRLSKIGVVSLGDVHD